MELQEADETEACSAECAADEELRAELRVDETVERTAEWAAEAVMRPLNSGSRRVAAQARVARRAEDETVGEALLPTLLIVITRGDTPISPRGVKHIPFRRTAHCPQSRSG